MIDLNILEQLNSSTMQERLDNLTRILPVTSFIDTNPRMINNHIHTTYSFSPYSPTSAVYAARLEGLCTAGIVDHDSIGGAREFIAAGELIGLPTTIGIECRVHFNNTPFEDININNPDQKGVAYVLLHSVPHKNIDAVQEFFRPLREKRNIRNRKMVDNINSLMGTAIDFDKDIIPISMYHDGGSITERHLMKALAIANHKNNDIFELYDEIGRLKKECIPQVYIPATDECPTLDEIVDFAKEVDAILAYSYLGDVNNSVTGDKKAQKFEDEYLDELYKVIYARGIRAITYMPTRNTTAQLDRIKALNDKYGMFEISGEDVNSIRQRFVIDRMNESRFDNLIDSTWKLIKHERA